MTEHGQPELGDERHGEQEQNQAEELRHRRQRVGRGLDQALIDERDHADAQRSACDAGHEYADERSAIVAQDQTKQGHQRPTAAGVAAS